MMSQEFKQLSLIITSVLNTTLSERIFSNNILRQDKSSKRATFLISAKADLLNKAQTLSEIEDTGRVTNNKARQVIFITSQNKILEHNNILF